MGKKGQFFSKWKKFKSLHYINSNNNQLESIFLEDAVKYKFDENKDFSLVQIPSHTFCIPFSRVLNMNLTYVNKERDKSRILNFFWWFLQILYYSFVFILISFVFLEDIPNLSFSKTINKISFCVNSWMILLWIKNILQRLIYRQEDQDGWSTSYLIGIVIGLFQYLWIFDKYPFLSVLGFSMVLFFLLIIWLVKIDKNDKEVDEGKKAKIDF